MPLPRAVLFDFGQTLLRTLGFDPVAGSAAKLRLCDNPRGVDAATLQAKARELLDDLDRVVARAEIDFTNAAFSRLLFSHFDLRPRGTPAEMDRAFWGAAVELDPMPGIGEVLDLLAAAGVPRAVVSNTSFPGEILGEELAKHGLAERFGAVITSADHVFRKPHPQIFGVALRALGVEPGRDVWMVGDDFRADVRGADRAGLTPVWFNRGEDAPPDDAPSHHVVVSMGELAALLERNR